MYSFDYSLDLLYPPQTKFEGVYRNHPVRPSMYLVRATPPKRLIGKTIDLSQVTDKLDHIMLHKSP
jgi:hypothetical protein